MKRPRHTRLTYQNVEASRKRKTSRRTTSSEHAAEGGVVATHDVDTEGNSPNTNTSCVLQSHDTIQVPNNEQKPLKPINNSTVGQAISDVNMQISISFTIVFYADKTLNKMHFRTLNLKSSKSDDFELKIPMSLVIDVNGRMCNTLYGYLLFPLSW
ncbi:hypothetical protein Tco_0542855 [Tanacetum coccineum]